MRVPFASLALFCLVLLPSACAQHGYAQGSVSYTTTPASADHSGALSLQALVCVDPTARDYRRAVRLGLGDRCVLVGPFTPEGGRQSRGGMARLVPDGVCAVPMATGNLALNEVTATFQEIAAAVDITVGGRSADGRYVTYRFTGALDGDNDEGRQCDALLEASR
jgi:hypothetical protein